MIIYYVIPQQVCWDNFKKTVQIRKKLNSVKLIHKTFVRKCSLSLIVQEIFIFLAEMNFFEDKRFSS